MAGEAAFVWVVGRARHKIRLQDDSRRPFAPHADAMLQGSPVVAAALRSGSIPPATAWARPSQLGNTVLGIAQLQRGCLHESVFAEWNQEERFYWRLGRHSDDAYSFRAIAVAAEEEPLPAVLGMGADAFHVRKGMAPLSPACAAAAV
eukprot:6629888-Alexandrium_andersonii.AAC.1